MFLWPSRNGADLWKRWPEPAQRRGAAEGAEVHLVPIRPGRRNAGIDRPGAEVSTAGDQRAFPSTPSCGTD